eukprot:s1629_g19.t1
MSMVGVALKERAYWQHANSVNSHVIWSDMATVVKVQCDDGEIYRLTLQAEPSFESVVQVVASCRPELTAAMLCEGGSCALKYADEEGDLCTLAPSTFVDFLEQQRGSNSRLLKLKLFLPKQPVCEKDASREQELERPERRAPLERQGDRSSLVDPPIQGPPPGLEKEETGDCFGGCTGGPGAWGPGGNGGGPRRLLAALRMLQETGMLTPAMFASLAVQWLPLLTQRVARKVDKINHVARDGLNETWKKLLERIQELAAETPGLESFASPISEALRGGNGQRRLGEAILELLKALRGLSFEVQTSFCEQVSASLLPFLEDLTRSWTGDECAPSGNLTPWQHHFGIKCEGCGVNPIVGPRFKCPVCPSYDLCGNCYPSKLQLHGNCPGCRKDFQCFIFPGKDSKSKGSKGVGEKPEKASCEQRSAEWKGWAGKGAGPLGLVASMAAGLGHGIGAAGGFPFPPLGNACGFPFPGNDFCRMDEGQQDLPWMDHVPWGKGKGKKGWRKSKGWNQEEHKTEELSAEDEFEKKLASLRELRLGSDEVLREVLIACDGDFSSTSIVAAMDGTDKDLGWEDVGARGGAPGGNMAGRSGLPGKVEAPNISDAVTSAMMNQFARELTSSSLSLWPQFVQIARRYFNVHHGYVLRKLLWQLMPFHRFSSIRHDSSWIRGWTTSWTNLVAQALIL